MSKHINKWFLYTIVFVALLSIVGCSQPNNSSVNKAKTSSNTTTLELETETTQNKLSTIEISPSFITISVGSEIQLTATGLYEDGASESMTTQVEWSSSNTSALSISEIGKLTSLSVGLSTITATLDGVSISFELSSVTPLPIDTGAVNTPPNTETVEPTAPIVNPTTLTSINITPQRQNIALGITQPLTATGIYSDNTTQDISASVTWTNESTGILNISKTNNIWVAEAIGLGTANITATLGNATASTQITVTDATLVDIFIDNIPDKTIVDTTTTLKAVGIFSDGSNQNITDQVSWSSSQTNIATFANNGELSAIAVGNSTINAALNDISVNFNLEIIDATLASIALSPSNLSLAEGTSSQLQAIGTLSNGYALNMSDKVSWSSNDDTVLSVNASGLVFGELSGDAIITASFDGVTSSLNITVDSATLMSIEVSPQNSRIAIDTELTLVATGIYSNGKHQDITQNVLWQTDDASIVSVSNTEGQQGLVYSLAQGSASISATLLDTVGSTNITVNEKTLEGITILFNGSSTLAAGNETQLSAIANYSNGSTMDVSSQVTWQSSDTASCTVSTAEDNYGLLKAKSVGMCNITAKLSSTASGTQNAISKFNSLIFTVTAATLQSIVISENNVSLAKGTSIQLTATGTFSDSSTSNISSQVNWTVSNALINISNENGSNGLLTAAAIGESIVTASYEGITTTSTVTVTAATLESITISTSVSGDFILGTTRSYTATGTYSDQSALDISTKVLWISSDANIAAVSNAIDSAGQVTSLLLGDVAISAKLNGIISDQIEITISDSPLAPISLSAQATPYIILNDGNDASTIQLSIQAANSELSVVDGTEVQLSITTGNGILSENMVSSVNGSASFTLTSTDKGIITIKASIAGTEIANYVTIYATDKFSEVISRYGFAQGALIVDETDPTNSLVPANSKIGFLIANYANRAFTIDGYSIFNGSTFVNEISSHDTNKLNNNSLSEGGSFLVTYTTSEARSNNYWVAYTLTEEKTGQQFVIAAGFTFK